MSYDRLRMSVGKVFLALLALLAMTAACSRSREDSDCPVLRDQARSAASQGDLTRASELLAEARARCGTKFAYDIQRIERLIEERSEKEVASQKLDPLTGAEPPPGKQFVRWVVDEGSDVTKNVTNIRCAERGSPDFGFCEAERPGSPHMTVRYWEPKKNAFRYSLVTEAPINCQDVGDHRRVRTWSRGKDSFELCEPTQHELRGLSALLERTGSENRMFIFSQAYLQKDREFERTLATRP